MLEEDEDGKSTVRFLRLFRLSPHMRETKDAGEAWSVEFLKGPADEPVDP